MKKQAVFVLAIVVVLLAIPAQGAKPVIVRDKFSKAGYHVFIPADDEGKYWSRWTLDWPFASKDTLYPIHEVFYGIVRPGEWQDYNDGSGSTWSLVESYGWQSYRAYTAGLYREWTIPDGHNRIHVITKFCSGVLNVTINGGTEGLDVTSIDTGSGDFVKETIVSTNSTATIRTLRLTKADGSGAEIIGIHSFDDDAVGDPNTSSVGLAVGHDLVDQHHYNHYWGLENDGISGQCERILKFSTLEFTIKWKEASEASTKWTAYGLHYGGPNADFAATRDPVLYIDAVSQGAMYDTGNIALAELHEADSIVTLVEGFGDYDRDGVEDGEDILKVRLGQDFTKTGVGIAVRIEWSDDGVVDAVGPYIPAIPVDNDLTGHFKLLPDETEIELGADPAGSKGNANAVVVYPDGVCCIITGQSLGPVDYICGYGGGTNKLNFKLKSELLEGGTTPADGDIWTVGGFIAVRKTGRIPGDLNNDCKVDFADFAILASHWLECNLDPPEACWE